MPAIHDNESAVRNAQTLLAKVIHEAMTNGRDGSFGVKVSIRTVKGKPMILKSYRLIEDHAA